MMRLEPLIEKFGQPAVIKGVLVFNSQNMDNLCSIKADKEGNILVLPDRKLRGKISIDFRSTAACAFIASEYTRANALIGHGSVLYIGEDTTFTTAANFTLAEGKDIYVGPSCMFAENVTVSNTDGHRIFSHDGTRLNHGRDIIIGEHVWLGRNSEVLKGSMIHSGAIVGARSLVSSEIPPNTICVGVPAKPIRSDAYFERTTTVRHRTEDMPEPGQITMFDRVDPTSDPMFMMMKFAAKTI